MGRQDPEGQRLPIKLDTTTNGEFAPAPLSPMAEAANRHAHEKVSDAARKLGVSRRAYLISTCGAATTLAAMNDVFAAADATGGACDIPKEGPLEEEAAEDVLTGDEFIFDVQLHHVNPRGRWRETTGAERGLRNYALNRPELCRELDLMECLNGETILREVFLDSDTTAAVLSSVPSAPDNPLLTSEAAETRARGEAQGLTAPPDSRPLPSQLSRPCGEHGRGARHLRHRRMEDLHPMGTGRRRLLAGRRVNRHTHD